ncbi:MAG: hypothetical protein KF841_14170 [Phycisphaerae bacterium]|nr:hypothetical protein [Phycisphaerae bacterium]
MPASSPFWAIDTLVKDQLANYAPLAAMVPGGRLQAWDRRVDIRRNLEDAVTAGKRIIIMPNGTEIDPRYSSGSARFLLRYELLLFSGKMLLEDIRKMEWYTCCALIRMWKEMGPEPASTLDTGTAEPLIVEAFIVGQAQQDKLPLDLPEEWESVMELTVVADGSTDAIAAIV